MQVVRAGEYVLERLMVKGDTSVKVMAEQDAMELALEKLMFIPDDENEMEEQMGVLLGASEKEPLRSQLADADSMTVTNQTQRRFGMSARIMGRGTGGRERALSFVNDCQSRRVLRATNHRARRQSIEACAMNISEHFAALTRFGNK